MKLAVSTYSLLRWRTEKKKSLEDSLAWIADQGIDGVEFAGLGEQPVKDPVKRVEQLRKRCEKLGLVPVSYCVGAELLRPESEQRKVVDELKVHVDAAAALGVPSMRHDVTRGWGANAAGVKGPKTFDRALKVVVPAIREVADHGAERGVKTSFENHGFFMQGGVATERLLKAVRHPNFALTIDMGNFLCVNDDPVKAVARCVKYAVMAHVKDFHLKPKKQMPPVGWFATPTDIALRGAIVGHGVIDVPAQVKLLKKAGYKWYLSLEFEGMEDPAKAVQLGLEYLKPLVK